MSTEYEPMKSEEHTEETRIVITSQPTGVVGEPVMREWSSSLFDCTDDLTKCLCVCFCSPLYTCYKMSEFGEHCCAAWLFGNVMTTAMLRYRIRHTHNIKGSLCKDGIATLCCYPCMACQLFREHEKIRKSKSIIQTIAETGGTYQTMIGSDEKEKMT